MAKDKDLLEDAKEYFQLAQEFESENRQNWLDDSRFSRLGEQWPEAVRKQRELEGRPCLTFNRLPAFMRQVINDARQNKPAIMVSPVGDKADVQTAEIMQGLIRNIEVTSHADVAYDTAIEHAVAGGFGYFKIGVDYAHNDTFDRDIVIERIANPLTVFGDPFSTSADSSDWNTAFITDLWDEEAFEKRWPDAKKTSFENSDDDQDWFGEERIRVAEFWRREEVESELLLLPNNIVMQSDVYEAQAEMYQAMGLTPIQTRPTKSYKVMQYIITGAEILETNDWKGRYIPIVPVYGDEINVEGKRYFYSLIRHARSAQESYNYWRTSAVEKVALDTKAPYIGPRGAFKSDIEKWMSANVTNWPFIEYDGPTPPQRSISGGVPAADIQMALQASDDMKAIIGLHDASMGATGNEISGVAINNRRVEGDNATFHFIDNLSRAIRCAGKIIVDLIPHVYDQPRVIRILKEDGTSNNVPINQSLPGVDRIFDVTTGKYDVVVEAGPSYATKRQEASAQMVDLAKAYPPIMEVAGDLVVKNLDWPGVDELVKRLQAAIPAAAGENPEIQQLKAQAQQAMQQAQQESALLQAENQKLQLQVKDKSGDIRVKELEAEIKAAELRIKEQEVRLKELETQATVRAKDADTQAKEVETEAKKLEIMANINAIQEARSLDDKLGPLMEGMYAMHSSMQSGLGDIAKQVSKKRKRKASAVKQGDSWVLESIEEDDED